MIQLIPYIRECLRRHLSSKQAVMLIDFDKLKRDYQEHQYEIHSKLISIMSDRLSVHLQSLKSIEDWDIKEEEDKLQPTKAHTYLESLFKEVTTLHKVLSRYLSTSTLEVSTPPSSFLLLEDRYISASLSLFLRCAVL